MAEGLYSPLWESDPSAKKQSVPMPAFQCGTIRAKIFTQKFECSFQKIYRSCDSKYKHIAKSYSLNKNVKSFGNFSNLKVSEIISPGMNIKVNFSDRSIMFRFL